jgi:hypothetical protein
VYVEQTPMSFIKRKGPTTQCNAQDTLSQNAQVVRAGYQSLRVDNYKNGRSPNLVITLSCLFPFCSLCICGVCVPWLRNSLLSSALNRGKPEALPSPTGQSHVSRQWFHRSGDFLLSTDHPRKVCIPHSHPSSTSSLCRCACGLN